MGRPVDLPGVELDEPGEVPCRFCPRPDTWFNGRTLPQLVELLALDVSRYGGVPIMSQRIGLSETEIHGLIKGKRRPSKPVHLMLASHYAKVKPVSRPMRVQIGSGMGPRIAR